MTDYPGQADRELARSLIETLPRSVRQQLRFNGVDLEPAAEHVLYTALRRPRTSTAPNGDALLRAIARPFAAHPRVGRPVVGRAEVVVLVTQPVHARLFGPVADALVELGEPRPMLIAARTSEASHVRLDDATDADLRDFLPASAVIRLLRHAVRTSVALRRAPSTWTPVIDRAPARRLSGVLSAAIPRLAIDVARLSGLLNATRPRVVVCFNESGLLARLAPTTAALHGTPVLDLPHADATNPWGASGAGYDGVAVFGPHAAETMRLAGVAPGRILEIGPLGYDDLQPAELDLEAVPRRVLFASQRVDEEYPYLAESGKRLALESAFALAAAAGPAAVHILPHPTEAERDLRKVVASVSRAVDIPVAIEPTGRLHSLLPGAFALVTVSSQSIYEAVVTGVPAIAVYPPGSEVPVSYVADGVALGASSVHEAGRIGKSLLAPDRRAEVTDRARVALANRLGPLDGRASERAAEWLHDVGRQDRPRRATSRARSDGALR